MYDARDGFKLLKDVHARSLQWTVTGGLAGEGRVVGWSVERAGRLSTRVRCVRAAGLAAPLAPRGRQPAHWGRCLVRSTPNPHTTCPPAAGLPDTALSGDQRFLLYSSITPTVHMVCVCSVFGSTRAASHSGRCVPGASCPFARPPTPTCGRAPGTAPSPSSACRCAWRGGTLPALAASSRWPT